MSQQPKLPGPPKRGEFVTAEWGRAITEAVRAGFLRATGGIRLRYSSTGVEISGAAEDTATGVELVMVRTPGGGIPARNAGTGAHGVATCQLYSDDGTASTLGTATEAVHNEGPVAAGGNRDVYALRKANGVLYVINEWCS